MLFKKKPRQPLQLKSLISESFDGYIHGLVYIYNPNTGQSEVILDAYALSGIASSDYPPPSPVILPKRDLLDLVSHVLNLYRKQVSL